MKILATTHQAFLFVDIEKDGVEEIDSLKGTTNAFYGIHFDSKHVYLGCRHPLNDTGEVRIFDYNLRQIDSLSPGLDLSLPGIHQLLHIKGRIFVVATQKNGCGVYTIKDKSWRMWYPDRKWPEINKHHFNSIYYNNGKIHLLAMQGQTDPDKSEVFIFNSSFKLEETIPLGAGSHCLWEMDGKFHTLSSKKRSVESEDGTVIIKLPEDCWPRGVVVLPDQDRIVIGASPKTHRDGRPNSMSKLFIYDMNWSLIKEIRLGHYGNVYDIRAPGYRDLCSPTLKGRKVKI